MVAALWPGLASHDTGGSFLLWKRAKFMLVRFPLRSIYRIISTSQCWCGHLGSSTGLLGPDHTSQVSQVASIFSRPIHFGADVNDTYIPNI